MTQFTSVVRTGQAVVFSLAANRFAQAAFAVAFALVAGALLGADGVPAVINIGGHGGR